MESYCKMIAPRGEESDCLGLFPRAGARCADRIQSVLCCGFGVGPRGDEPFGKIWLFLEVSIGNPPETGVVLFCFFFLTAYISF